MNANSLAEITGGTWVNLTEDIDFAKAGVDSRLVEPGDLFVALTTEKADGHDYVSSAFSRGAAAALVDRPVADGPCLVVEDPLKALHQWAKAARNSFEGTVIGVIGSVGKTTAKDLLSFILSSQHNVHASPLSFNNHLGVPLTLVSTPKDAEYLIVEMGANAPGDLDFLGDIVKPDHLFVTPIREAHLEGFGDMKGVREAKGEMLAHLNANGWLVWPHDRELQASWQWPGSQLTWGQEQADLPPYPCQLEFPKTAITIGDDQFEINFPALWAGGLLSGVHGLLRKLGVEPDWAALEQFQNSPSRLEVLEVNGLMIINDAWNANPASVSHSLDVLSQTEGRHIFVLGDMLELGRDSSKLHRDIGEACHGKVDLLICVGDQSKRAAESFSGESQVFPDAQECEKGLSALVQEGDVVLFKGSRALALDKLANRFVPRRERA